MPATISHHCGYPINACANILVFLNVFMPLRGWNLKDRPAEEYKQQLLQFALKAIGIPVT